MITVTVMAPAIRWTNTDGESGTTVFEDECHAQEMLRDIALNPDYVTWHLTYVAYRYPEMER